jgi:hypothetical protein
VQNLYQNCHSHPKPLTVPRRCFVPLLIHERLGRLLVAEGASMIWKQERDALIAQTLAFVQSVSRKQEQTGTPTAVQSPQPVEPRIDNPIAAPSPETHCPVDTLPKPTPLRPITAPSPETHHPLETLPTPTPLRPIAAPSPETHRPVDTLPKPTPLRPTAVPSPETRRPLDTLPKPTPLRPTAAGDLAAEIQARVASFRAHQERFTREREEYFATTLARLRAAMNEEPPRPGN